MRLKELIERLEALPKECIFKRGFGSAHSWRGSYSELAFSPMENSKVSEMLAIARSAVGAVYHGWKGGEFEMDLETEVYLDEQGECCDDGDRIMELFGQFSFEQKRAAALADCAKGDHTMRRGKCLDCGKAASAPRVGCAFIEERVVRSSGKIRSTVCKRKAADRWRVRAVAPQDSSLTAYMLVPLCKGHGEKRGGRRGK